MRRLKRIIEIPEGISVEIDGGKVKVSGPNGTLEREFDTYWIDIRKEDNTVVVEVKKNRRQARAMCGTVAAHIRNMIKGVQKDFVYKLAIVYAHFPMKVTVKGKQIEILNFLGSKVPRYVDIPDNVKVEIKGKEIIVRSPDIEKAGMLAGRLEQATRKPPHLDERKFQDGIYIVSREWGA